MLLNPANNVQQGFFCLAKDFDRFYFGKSTNVISFSVAKKK